MREILFRGKRIENGEWAYGSLLKDGEAHRLASRPDVPLSDYYIVPKTERNNTEYKLSGGRWLLSEIAYHVIPETVGQYTGLTDKNGTKIFEGDICRNAKTGETVSVKWHGTMAGFVWSKPKENSHLYDFGELFRAHDKYEVVGNIHDNPELLGGADNDE